MFFCLNVSGQYPFTYTEIKESVYNVDGFIEKLIMDKDFDCVEKYKNSNAVYHASFAKDYDTALGIPDSYSKYCVACYYKITNGAETFVKWAKGY